MTSYFYKLSLVPLNITNLFVIFNVLFMHCYYLVPLISNNINNNNNQQQQQNAKHVVTHECIPYTLAAKAKSIFRVLSFCIRHLEQNVGERFYTYFFHEFLTLQPRMFCVFSVIGIVKKYCWLGLL